MSDAVAGPSSTSAVAPHSSPVRISHSASRSVEPYDSPLREADAFVEYDTPKQSAEASGSRARHGIPARDGIETVIYSRRDSKGKGKAAAAAYDHVPPDVRIPVQVEAESASGADAAADADEEAEERRIQENLAKWSKADAERRAALRRRHGQSTIVPPPAIPGASDLIRRTSTLLRTASQRRRPARGRSGPGSSGLTEEELELAAAAGRVHSPVLQSFDDAAGRATAPHDDREDLASRRDRRMMSLRLDSNVDLTGTQQDPALQSTSTARSNFSLSRVGEEFADRDEGNYDPLKTPTTENPPRQGAYGDPFSAPSQVSLVSTDPNTPRHARGGSVFIENLPPLPQSPIAISSAAAANPFATPQTSPVKGSNQPHPTIRGSMALRPIQSTSSFASRDPDNPFIDVVVTSPSPAKPNVSSHSRPGSTSRQSLVSLRSSSPPGSPTRAEAGARWSPGMDPYSAAHVAAAAGPMSGYRPPSPAYSASSNPASPLQGSGPRRRRSYDPRTEESATYDGRKRDDLARRGSPSQPRELQPEHEPVGWLSWLFCGCLRPENEDGAGDRDAVVEQRGRTNPME